VKAVAQYAGKAKEQTIAEFVLNIIPNTVIDAFARGDILPVVLISVLFGFVLARLGGRAKPIRDMIDAGSMLVFGAINVIMRFAPVGAFGAMAFTVGRYGIGSLGPLIKLVGLFYLTSAIFVFGVLGPIAWWSGFSIWKFLLFIKEESWNVSAARSRSSVW
jgi:aerobic C4-dicarboxylate transport protein